MKAQAAALEGEPPHVSLMFNAAETKELTEDLQELCSLAGDGGGVSEDTARVVDRIGLLIQLLRHELGHLEQALLVHRGTWPKVAADVALGAPPPAAAPGTLKGIPLEHVEWALKVYKLTASHSRASEHATLERTFPNEAQAKNFFGRTQNVHNMRVNGGEAAAYEVLLGVQDARKHKKKGSFREVDRALCTGGVK